MSGLVVFFFIAVFSAVPLALCDFESNEATFFLFSDGINDTELHNDNLYFVDVSLPTIFIIHGWEATSNDSWVVALTDAYLARGNYNIITVDWSQIASEEYLLASSQVKGIGERLADIIIDLQANYSASFNTFHLVGHSLGAHIAGLAGKALQNRAGIKVGRITGLDPAGPTYYLKSDEDKLADTDADLVVALHTDAGIAGYYPAIGNIDFYPNGGAAPQPGCYDLTTGCSHLRSVEFFTEAVYNPDGFVSTQCDLYLTYTLGGCSGNRNVTLGGNLTIADAGIYYLQTNPEKPYSKE